MNRRSSKSRSSSRSSSSRRREKVAKITSFSMGFGSYIREFLGAILILFRPSLHGVFPSGSCLLNSRRSSKTRSSRNRRPSSHQQQEEKVAKITSFSMGFRSYIREFLGAILILFRPSLPWCFPIRELLFE